MGVDDRLKARYSAIFGERGFPDWSYHIPPPIPFVGDHFMNAPKRVLVYASAENLNHRDQVNSLLALTDPMLRSSWFLDARRKTDQDSTFVHINPIDNGSLLLAARHVLYRLDPRWPFANNKPSAFLDQIAVANPGKFSIDPGRIGASRKRNYDYANDRIKFEEMRAYILADLTELTPDVIIIPRTIERTLRALQPMMNLAQNSTVVGIYQVSPQAINCHIKRQVPERASSVSGLPYIRWNVTDHRLNMRLYLQWLDQHPALREEPDGARRDRTHQSVGP
jgi:hypothetical protein